MSMDDGRGGGNNVDYNFTESSFITSGSSSGRQKLSTLLSSDRPRSTSPIATDEEVAFFSPSNSNMPTECCSPGYASDRDLPGGDTSTYMNMYSPWNQPSPYVKSPWSREMVLNPSTGRRRGYGLVGSMVREEGHVYSLAASGGLLYTGSDSKNVRVWKNMKEFSGFKSNSGLVKAIVVAGEKVYTGHQDGKIRVWKASTKNSGKHRRVGTLPTLKEMLRSSINPKNYVEVRRHRSSVWLRHFDAVSCLVVDEEEGLMYSGSWDKTVKVWRLADSKCMESIPAHDDSVNTVAATGFDSLVLTGSADGTLKVWRRESTGRRSTRHVLQEVLLRRGPAVNGLAVSTEERVVYGGSSDGSVQVWEKGKKRMVHAGALRGHKLAVLCLAAAGSLVFSGGADKTICVWRREASGGGHSWVAVLGGHGGPVKCLAVEVEEEEEEEGRGWVVYSGSLDRSVKVWRVGEEEAEMGGVAPPEEEFSFPAVVTGGGARGVGAICGGSSPKRLTC